MKFSVGDRVLMKRTGEEGTITAFLSKQIIEVEVGEIRFPVYADELDHPYLKWFTDPKAPKLTKRAKIVAVEKPASKQVRLSRGIYLSFLPQFAANSSDDIIESFKIHFLNETADHLSFTYHARDASGNTLLQLSGALHPFANIFLHTLSLGDVNAQPRFHWQVAAKEKPERSVNGVLRIRPAQLIRQIAALIHDGEPSFSIMLTQDAEALPMQASMPKPIQIGNREELPTTFQDLETDAQGLLDLHLTDIGDAGTTDAALLMATQLKLLQRKLEAAHVAGFQKMIIIHGIGNGRLRASVHDLLRDTLFVTRFSNEWMPAYGWGATEVFFA